MSEYFVHQNKQFNSHGYYLSFTAPCGCCTIDSNSFIDEAMAQFELVGCGIFDIELENKAFAIDTRYGFSIHTEPCLGREPLEVPMLVDFWINDWHSKWMRKQCARITRKGR
jgi:hypothetical protein